MGMISLIFESDQLAKTTKLAPAPFFRVTGNFISQGPDRTPVAKFSNHFWDMHGQQHFTQYACHDRAVVRFEDALGSTARKACRPVRLRSPCAARIRSLRQLANFSPDSPRKFAALALCYRDRHLLVVPWSWRLLTP